MNTSVTRRDFPGSTLLAPGAMLFDGLIPAAIAQLDTIANTGTNE